MQCAHKITTTENDSLYKITTTENDSLYNLSLKRTRSRLRFRRQNLQLLQAMIKFTLNSWSTWILVLSLSCPNSSSESWWLTLSERSGGKQKWLTLISLVKIWILQPVIAQSPSLVSATSSSSVWQWPCSAYSRQSKAFLVRTKLVSGKNGALDSGVWYCLAYWSQVQTEPYWFTRLVNLLLRDRRFRVHIGNDTSSWRSQRNGLPRGSVLAPVLFNLYTNDLPATRGRKFIYADDICLATATQAQYFSEL